MNITRIPAFTDNYFWLLSNKNNHFATIVDPGDSKPVLNTLQNEHLILESILVTHHHNDHVGANLKLQKKYKCEVVGNQKDKARIPGISIFVNEGDKFKLGDSVCNIIDVSGHTMGHICYYFSKESLIFCGDTLFSLGCGRLFEGTPDIMVESLLKIKEQMNTDAPFLWRYATGVGEEKYQSEIKKGWILEETMD